MLFFSFPFFSYVGIQEEYTKKTGKNQIESSNDSSLFWGQALPKSLPGDPY